MLDKLPDEINSIIISYLVPKNPKCVMELENYRNLSLLNKEYHNNVSSLEYIYKILKKDINRLKLEHIYIFEIVKYELQYKVDTVLPTNTNEGCLICGAYIPNWWPKIYSSLNNIYPISKKEIELWDTKTSGLIGEGVCGSCNKYGIICKICINNFNIKTLENLTPKWVYDNLEPCSCCFNFKKCKWCGDFIHPLKYLNKDDEMSNYCDIECYESDRDYLFFAFIESGY